MDQKAWLFLAYGDDRQYGGNIGYDDGSGQYSFDSNVPNWKRVAEGDLVIVAGRGVRHGPPVPVAVARIERLSAHPDTKTIYRCPNCGHPRFKARETKSPRWRCDFGHEFDEPDSETVDVTAMTAYFGDSYRPMPGAMTTEQLKTAQMHKGDGNAIRPLDLEAVTRFLRWDPDVEPVIAAGGAFPDPKTASLVDAAAIPVAVRLTSERFPESDVSVQPHSNPGYDLLVKRGGRILRFVEVKASVRADGAFFMSEYQRCFSKEHPSKYSLLLLSQFDPDSGRCSFSWFDGDICDQLNLSPIRYQGSLAKPPG